MKLVIMLVGLPLTLSYVMPYKGFVGCGEDGWSCNQANGTNEITYKCSPTKPGARVWIWTARLPTGASIFTVRDCQHLEVHVDCTKGLRTTALKQFNVVNVKNLEFLPPLLPGIFLHDNDQIPQMPPILSIENVESTKFYPGLFDKPSGGACKYKFVEISTLRLAYVHIDKLMKALFFNKNFDSVVLKNVVIDAMESNALSIKGNASIVGTTFPNIPANAIQIKGESVSFVGNTFRKIESLGLTIRSKEFNFTDNYVEEIAPQGLNVMGANIAITKNQLIHLDSGALEKITPGYSPVSYEPAFPLTYNFSENLLKNINPGSMHINWEAYKKVCSEITIKNNAFECSCVNLGWISISNVLGPKIARVKEFYDLYLNKDENLCVEQENCSLKTVMMQIQDVCNNKTNVSNICAAFDVVTEVGTESSVLKTKPTLLKLREEVAEFTEQQVVLTEPFESTEKAIPVFSYVEDQTTNRGTLDVPIWFAVVPVIMILAAISVGLFMWWYKRRKQRQIVTTAYKNERGIDADGLIVINEHHNELYDKQ